MQAPRWVLIWRSQGKKKNLLGFRARASRISSLASGRGGPRYCGGQQSGLKKRLSSPKGVWGRCVCVWRAACVVVVVRCRCRGAGAVWGVWVWVWVCGVGHVGAMHGGWWMVDAMACHGHGHDGGWRVVDGMAGGGWYMVHGMFVRLPFAVAVARPCAMPMPCAVPVPGATTGYWQCCCYWHNIWLSHNHNQQPPGPVSVFSVYFFICTSTAHSTHSTHSTHHAL
jgi:hypothetical protein